jgi:hypothetical protein
MNGEAGKRRVAMATDLQGRRPSDLRIEHPTRFVLCITKGHLELST